jgi:hypothetical protein
MTPFRTGVRNAWWFISRCKAFRTHGALSGTDKPVYSSGMLEGDARDRFMRDRLRIDYTVLSYGTPIAWHTPEGWFVVEDKFSKTTSRHQSVTRAALCMGR